MQTSRALALALLGLVTQTFPAIAEADDLGVAQEEIIDGLRSSRAGIGALETPSDTCTAFLITSRVALTAAHCLDGASASSLHYCTGDRRPMPGESMLGCVGVTRFEQHSLWGTGTTRQERAVHDIGVVLLSSAQGDPFFGVRASEFTNAEVHTAPGLFTDIYGFGETHAGTPNYLLHTVHAPLVSVHSTGTYLSGQAMPTPTTFIGALCHGDSGGPWLDASGNAFAVSAQTDPGCTNGGFAAPIRSAMPSLICPFLQRAGDADGQALCGYTLPGGSDPGQSSGGCRATPGSSSWRALAFFAIALGACGMRRNRKA